jgi:hypothetical protein
MSKQNPENPMDPMWQIHMRTLTKRMKNMEIAQTIDDALYQYYVVEKNEKVPNWRYIKDQDWWIEYLIKLGIDPKNP